MVIANPFMLLNFWAGVCQRRPGFSARHCGNSQPSQNILNRSFLIHGSPERLRTIVMAVATVATLPLDMLRPLVPSHLWQWRQLVM